MFTLELPEQLYALKACDQFIICELKFDAEQDKLLKLPLNPVTFYKHNPHDPKIWLSYDAAVEKLIGYEKNYGLGFVLTDKDPFFCLDIDGCLIGKALNPLYSDLVDRLENCAIEVSQSGQGLHVWGQYKNILKHTTDSTVKINHKPLELYSAKQFIFLTGDIWLKHEGTCDYDATQAVNTLITEYFTRTENVNEIQAWTDEPHPDWDGYPDDEELIAAALRSRSAKNIFAGKLNFSELWTANVEAIAREFPAMKSTDDYDASRADAALAQHLAFWCGSDCERMLRLIHMSGLKREKWEREEYLRNTILNAVSRQTQFHSKKGISKTTTSLADTGVMRDFMPENTFKDAEGIKEKWKDYIYVEDLDQVLKPNNTFVSPKVFRHTEGGFCFQITPSHFEAKKMKTTTDAWRAYSESQCFHPIRVHTTCFLPQFKFQDILQVNELPAVNTWLPPNVKRKKGSVAIFEDLVRRMFPVERDSKIILSYFAACTQYPGVKFDWTIYLQSVQGTGKNTMIEFLTYAIGQEYVYQVRAKLIGNKFNKWMLGKLLICVNEVNTAINPDTYEVIKNLITDKVQEIEKKGKDQINKNICCNYIFTGNHKDGLPQYENERRFAMFFAAQQTKAELIRDGLTEEYFEKVYNFRDKQDGLAIVADFLHSYNIPDEFNPATKARRAPHTSSTAEAIMFSKPAIEQEIFEAVQQGHVGFRGGWVSGNYLDNFLLRLGYNKLSYVHRNQAVLNLGYIKHPKLPEGRATHPMPPDNKRTRLYCVKNHETLAWDNIDAILEHYTISQNP